MAKTIWYVSPSDGKKYRLIEADRDRFVSGSRLDHEKGIIGDGFHCYAANATNRQPGVVETFVGAANDTIILEKRGDEIVAVHYVNTASLGRIRDSFDQNQELDSYMFRFQKPSPSQTLAAMEERKRRARERHAHDKLAIATKPTKGVPAAKALDYLTKQKKRAVQAKAQTKAPVLKSKKAGNRIEPMVLTKPIVGKRRTRVQRFGIPHRDKLPIITED